MRYKVYLSSNESTMSSLNGGFYDSIIPFSCWLHTFDQAFLENYLLYCAVMQYPLLQ